MQDHLRTGKRILTNGIWNTTAAVVTGLITFLLVPFLLRHLGQQAYGVWVLIGSIFAYSTIFNFGLSSAINRYIPVGLAQGNDDYVRKVASTGTVFFGVVGFLIAGLSIVVYINLTSWFNIPPALVDVARRALLTVGILLSITVVVQTSSAILSGYQRYDLTAGSRVFMLVLRAVALVIALTRGAGLLTVAVVYGLTELGVNLLQMGIARRLMPRNALSLKAFDSGLLREMLGYGLNTFLYGTGAVIAYKATELIIGAFLQSEDVAHYSIAATGVLMLTTLIDSLSAALKPAVSDLDARDETASIRKLSLLSQKYTLFLIIPSTAFLVILGREFLHIWTGLGDPDMPIVLALLALAQAIRLSQHSNFLVLVGKGEHRFFGFSVLVIGASVVLLSVLALGVFHAGIVGVAVASFISWGIVCGIIIPMHVNARLHVSWRERWGEVLRPVAASCLPSIALLLVWKTWYAPNSWAQIGAGVLLCALTTLLAAWQFGLTAAERTRFAQFFLPAALRPALKPMEKHSQ